MQRVIRRLFEVCKPVFEDIVANCGWSERNGSRESGVYDRLYPDVEIIDYGNGITDSYNWDTNEYQDVEIINDYGNEVEVYNWDTGQYEMIPR